MKIKKYTVLLSAILSVGILITGCSGAKTASTTGNTQASDSALPKEIRLGYFQSPNGELLAKGEKLLEKNSQGFQLSMFNLMLGVM